MGGELGLLGFNGVSKVPSFLVGFGYEIFSVHVAPSIVTTDVDNKHQKKQIHEQSIKQNYKF
jgi:hypothetical protein